MLRKTIRLPVAQAQSIDAAVATGAYRNHSAVIRAALRLWQREQEERRLTHAWAALAQGPNGELNTQQVLWQGRMKKSA